jgi:asparagine synthase (glutamine-hydrolysing)
MCGLSVFVSSRPQAAPPEPESIAAFSAARETMHHRGPDDTVVQYADGIAFGFKRLAVIDRAGSAQPVQYPASGRWTVDCTCENYT